MQQTFVPVFIKQHPWNIAASGPTLGQFDRDAESSGKIEEHWIDCEDKSNRTILSAGAGCGAVDGRPPMLRRSGASSRKAARARTILVTITVYTMEPTATW